jgi:hypothetical protein
MEQEESPFVKDGKVLTGLLTLLTTWVIDPTATPLTE